MPCPNCQSTSVTNKPCGPHIGEYCDTCGRWLRWVPQGNLESFKWPIGKTHKGTPILTIAKTKPDYLLWVIENVSSPNLVKKATEALTRVGVKIPPKKPLITPHIPQNEDDQLPW